MTVGLTIRWNVDLYVTLLYADVKERLDNLEELFKPGFDEVAKKIGAWQAVLLTYQIFVMKTYVEVLDVRIDNIEQSIKNSK